MSLYPNRLVVKVGTSTLINGAGRSDLRIFDRLARVLADVQNRGYQVILVSSGAIAVGARKLRMNGTPDSMRLKQAAAAVGQCRNLFLYDRCFREYDKTVAQILLNAEDLRQEERVRHLIQTFDALLELGVIPIVNENDSARPAEAEPDERLFGDNDLLGAEVAVLCGARRLVIFSDMEGLTDRDPGKDPEARLLARTDGKGALYPWPGGSGSHRGRGGVRTKLQAAARAVPQGIDVVITNGKEPQRLYDLLDGRPVGTCFPGRSLR